MDIDDIRVDMDDIRMDMDDIALLARRQRAPRPILVAGLSVMSGRSGVSRLERAVLSLGLSPDFVGG